MRRMRSLTKQDYVIKSQIAATEPEGTLANPLACSGVLIEICQSGGAHEILPFVLQLERAFLDEQRAQWELDNINNIFSSSRYAIHNPHCIDTKLKARAEKWQTQLFEVRERIAQLGLQLDTKFPRLFSYLVSHRDQIGGRRPAVRHGRKLTGHHRWVEERNRVIRQHADKPHLVICYELDDRFPAPDSGPAPQIPRKWFERFGVVSFHQAYSHPECRALIHRMFSGVLKGLPKR